LCLADTDRDSNCVGNATIGERVSDRESRINSIAPSALRYLPAKVTKRILVVDDNRDLAESLALVLRLWGHDARVAHDGRTALDVARDYTPDVVFLDLGLPCLDGYEVARRLRLRPEMRRTLLVAVTGYGQEDDRRRSREAGFDLHLTKPVDPIDLRPLLADGAVH